MTLGQKILVCLLSNVAMGFGVKSIAAYEGTGTLYTLLFILHC